MTTANNLREAVIKNNNYNKSVLTKLVFIFYFIIEASTLLFYWVNPYFKITELTGIFGGLITIPIFVRGLAICILTGVIGLFGIKSINKNDEKVKTYFYLMILLQVLASASLTIKSGMFSSEIIEWTIYKALILIVRIVPAIICIAVYSKDTVEKSEYINPEIKGIGGFMIIILIRCIFIIYSHGSSYYSGAGGFPEPISILLGFIQGIFGVAVATYALVALIRKRKIFIPLIIASEGYLIYNIITTSIVPDIVNIGGGFAAQTIANIMIAVVSGFIILYICKSSRVYNTFVRKEPM